MRVSFGRFELDEKARTLRLDGQEQVLQPLVFDLLVYLVKNRDRVVSKDELLSELWNEVTVTDGSLQRAVSLLRSTLRAGDLPDAVQTFARRGYRFSAPSAGDQPSSVGSTKAPTDTTAAEEWEATGSAEIYAGRAERAVEPLERAVASFEEHHDLEGAARAALMLCNVKLENRELAIARGWHERALSFLGKLDIGKQHGLAEWLASRLAMFEGRIDDAGAHATRAKEIGNRVADPDVQCLALVYEGHILIAKGETRKGLAMHDEAGALALAGRSGAFASGIVFCSIILAYLHLGDQHRAAQWTDEFTRWCTRHDAYNFPALCRLHRGEALAARGDLEHAETEVRLAREQLASTAPYVEGDAHRVLGDILLCRGDLAGAETAFRAAHRLGWNPQPGMSLLLAAKGQLGDAVRQLERALLEPAWTAGQRRGTLLAVVARLAAMNGQLDVARSALAELEASPERCASKSCVAERARAEAELARASGDLRGAEAKLREAISTWLEMGAKLQAADVRLRLCELLVSSAEMTAADLELACAESVFQEVNAALVLARCAALRSRLTPSS